MSVEEFRDEDDGWFDDDPVPPQEEPDCCACNDSGGRCCEPTRLDILRWRIRSRIRLWTQGLRRQRPGNSDKAPF